MSREIKFRLWSKICKIFIETNNPNLETGEDLTEDEFVFCDGNKNFFSKVKFKKVRKAKIKRKEVK